MEIVALLILGALVVVAVKFVARSDKPSDSMSSSKSSPPAAVNVGRVASVTRPSKPAYDEVDDPLAREYKSLFSVFDDYLHRYEFDLYGTKAAIVWNELEKEVTVICCTGFVKGKPVTQKYDYYLFDMSERYWMINPPRGCAAEVKKHIEKLAA